MINLRRFLLYIKLVFSPQACLKVFHDYRVQLPLRNRLIPEASLEDLKVLDPEFSLSLDLTELLCILCVLLDELVSLLNSLHALAILYLGSLDDVLPCFIIRFYPEEEIVCLYCKQNPFLTQTSACSRVVFLLRSIFLSYHAACTYYSYALGEEAWVFYHMLLESPVLIGLISHRTNVGVQFRILLRFHRSHPFRNLVLSLEHNKDVSAKVPLFENYLVSFEDLLWHIVGQS